jgi:hypothetical protein
MSGAVSVGLLSKGVRFDLTISNSPWEGKLTATPALTWPESVPTISSPSEQSDGIGDGQDSAARGGAK